MQRYTEIPSSTTLTESLPLILNNDKTALSCSAGTAFPTTNVQQGMLCYRTNENKLYQLVDITKPTWRVVADLNGDARNLDGGFGNVINYDKQNLNDWQNMPTGFYQGSNMLNAPSGDTAWRVIQIRYGNSDGYSTQVAFGTSTGKVCTRYQSGGIWSAWQDFQIGADGKVIVGLNADKVDDKEPGNASGNISVNNGTLNTNLNADKLDGYHAGNKSGNIPISNGVVNTGLNADQVDSYHVGNAANQIPINNKKLNVGLNAEMLGGATVDSFLRIGSDGATDKKIGNLTADNATITNLSFSTTNQHHFDASDTSVSDVKTSNLTYEKSNHKDPNYYDYARDTGSYNRIEAGVPDGNYNIHAILRKLVACAHIHHKHTSLYYYNCDCNCVCNCND
jgi:hypothetical protein